MKKILQLSSLLFITFYFAQQVSDYQYIYVPEKFSDKGVNKYGLNELLQLKLKQKKYTVLPENRENWPPELAQNPCEMLTANLSDTSNMFKNRLILEFKDCQNKSLLILEGKSSIKEFEPGMRAALEDAGKNLPMSMPVERQFAVIPRENNNNTEPVKKEVVVVIEKSTAQVVPAPKTQATADQKAEVYSNGSVTFNRIFLANGEFILVNPNNSVPYATFKPSTKTEVYRVQLSDGTATLGYLEKGNIIVELANSDGSFRKQVFNKK